MAVRMVNPALGISWALEATSSQTPVPTVTSLPANPVDRMEVDLLVDSAGNYGGPFLWRCKYRAATTGSYKWHVIGGARPVRARHNGATSGQSGTSYSMDAPVVSVPAPAPGVYDVEFGANYLTSENSAVAHLSFGIGSAGDNWSVTAPSDADAVNVYHSSGTIRAPVNSDLIPKTLLAGQFCVMAIRGHISGAILVAHNRVIALHPRRLG